MADEHVFRMTLLCAWLAFIPVPAYYRIRAQSTGESLDRKQEGWFILITLRLAGLSTLLGVMAYLIRPDSMAWSSLPLPYWLRWTGLGLFVLGDLLLTWTLMSLGKNLTDTVVTRREHTLVVTGPYRWVRHPFYDCVGLIIAGSALLTANWFVAAAGTLLFVMFATRCSIEEEKLIARFGDEYRQYMERTGRFIPTSV
jgi:protein-S-isoprenylcysteine O-methyltransferase Ste14